MTPTITGEDFEQLSWHDNFIYGVHFYCREWEAHLVLDIDYIVEWICGVDQSVLFRMVPATLIFHDVTDLKVNIDWGDSGFQHGLHELSIDHIERVKVENQKICLDRPYYRWIIATNFPKSGEITFGATGFTQFPREEPVVCEQQQLPASDRADFSLAQVSQVLAKNNNLGPEAG